MEKSTLKSKLSFQNILTGLLALIVLGLICYNVFDGKLLKTENNVADIVKIDTAPPKVYVDPTGKTHVEKQVINLAPEQKAYFQNQIDSITLQLGIKEKQITGLISASGKAEVSFQPELRKDTNQLAGVDVDYKSKWFELQGNTANGKPWRRIVRDSITAVFYNKPSGFLKLGKTQMIDIHSANEDMQYLNVRSWQVPNEKKSRIGFGVTVGYGVQLNKNNVISHGIQATGGLQFRF